MIKKIMRFLIKIEKWALEKCIGKDDSEYADYLRTIQKHEKAIEGGADHE